MPAAEGNSDQPALISGHFLEISDHPRNEWNDLWLIHQVRHEGKQPQVLEESMTHDIGDADGFQQGYRNSFVATPWDIPFRPPLLHPKPQVLGSQTAVVTGPAGEEIHCDEYGRIKVQFHWDRQGSGDDKSSCWLRVASNWAGDLYGGIAIPRVGMEVLTTFLEADPDQPVVSGCLYHKENRVPYALPANKTTSTFKTLSTPGGAGYNELRLEDKKGEEQIFIHAQRNLDENIEHDQKIHIGNERHDTVEANSFSEFKAEEHVTVTGARKVETKANDHLSIGVSQHTQLGTAQLTKAGREIHLKTGQKMVIEAGVELTLQAGGSFIKLDPSGISMVGPIIRYNAGGAPGKGTGIGALLPVIPLPVDMDKAGELLEQALAQDAQPSTPILSVLIAPLPNAPGYPDLPYQLFADGALIDKGFTDSGGYARFEHIPGTQSYSVKTPNGHDFELVVSEEPTEQTRSRFESLGRQGYRSYPAGSAKLEPITDQETFRAIAAGQTNTHS